MNWLWFLIVWGIFVVAVAFAGVPLLPQFLTLCTAMAILRREDVYPGLLATCDAIFRRRST